MKMLTGMFALQAMHLNLRRDCFKRTGREDMPLRRKHKVLIFRNPIAFCGDYNIFLSYISFYDFLLYSFLPIFK